MLSDCPEFAALSNQDQWEALRRRATLEGLAPLLAYRVRGHLSPSGRKWCTAILTSCWNQHSRRLGQLDCILQILQGAEIRVLALKGPLLAVRYYQPAFLRKPSVDLDLGIARKDLRKACAVLAGAGYLPELPVDEAIARNHHVALQHSSHPRLELHFRLSHGVAGIPIEPFFERALPYILPDGRAAWVLGRADELLHLILHRAYGSATLFHLYEIRRIWLQSPVAVRQEAMQRAVDHHFAGVLRLTDAAFKAWWGEPLLPAGLPNIQTWMERRIDADFYQKFESYSAPGIRVTNRLWIKRKWLELQMTDSFWHACQWSFVLLAAMVRTSCLRVKRVAESSL